jgi:hypothetical protein
MGNKFISIDNLIELGETIFCVYFYKPYELKKAYSYMKWKGFRTDLVYNMDGFTNDTITVFYQDEKYVPELDSVDQFYKTIDELNIWEKMDGCLYDYKYRVLSDGVICISFISVENAYINSVSGKVKKE